jgi:hypothetical protein
MYFIPRSWDPVIEEAALGTTVAAPGRSCQEEIAVMVEQLANPPLIAISSCLSKPLPPVDIQTQQLFKSEEEQLVGPPLSPPSHHESSLSFEAIVVHPKENQSSYQ